MRVIPPTHPKQAAHEERRRKTSWRERVKRAAAPRQAVRPDAGVRIPWIPSPILIDCLVRHGMPRRHAVLIRGSKQLYYVATRFYFDVAEAEAGDRAARERVDHFRESQENLRKIEKEQLHVDPDRSEQVRRGASKPSVYLPRGVDASS